MRKHGCVSRTAGEDRTPVLLTSRQQTSTTALLAEAAARRGIHVQPLGSPQQLTEPAGRQVHWYGGPHAASRYAVHGRLDTAPLHQDAHKREVHDFTERLLAATGTDLPSAVTVDIGLLQDPDTGRETWAAVEANMPWFAHSYAADPDGVLTVVLNSTGPRTDFPPRDRPFLRRPRKHPESCEPS